MRVFAKHSVALLFFVIVAGALLSAQSTLGTLKGVVEDESGAVIPNAVVTATVNGRIHTAAAGPDGSFTMAGLPAGVYTVAVKYEGMAPYSSTVTVGAGATATLKIQLQVALETQHVTVEENSQNHVSVDPSANVGALVLKGTDLDALSDDPDELQEDLQTLAGPAAGPNGGQIYIDGFSGGQLPPKSSIREIRINQNPFSAEYDKLGYGRIEIFTKPGTNQLHGQTYFNYSDDLINARNPFSTNKAPYLQRMYGGNLSGPLGHRASFFVDFQKRDINDDAVISATTLDSNFLPETIAESLVQPKRRTNITPRIDYQLSQNITLMGRYSYTSNDQNDLGIGTFNLPSQAYNSNNTQNEVQFTETQIIGTKAVNESRFQYQRERASQNALNSQTAIDVAGEFQGGGNPTTLSLTDGDHYEYQNNTSLTQGTHQMRFGIRVRGTQDYLSADNNFLGTFVFAGVQNVPALDANNQPIAGQFVNLTALEQYQRTLILQTLGYSPADIRSLGGGASQFSIAGGNPAVGVDQVDLGVFYQDDWRVKPNLTVSLGLRYEWQTNISDNRDVAPRVSFAWAPGAKSGRPGKTVFRGGAGIFYDRVDDSYTMNAIRYNGLNEQQYTVFNPDFFPVVPTISSLTASPQTIQDLYSGLRAPYVIQSAIGVERQLPFASTLSVVFTNTRGVHLLDTRNIAASPLAPNGAPLASSNGLSGAVSQLDLYESNGIMKQNMVNVMMNTNLGSRFTLHYGYSWNHEMTNTGGGIPMDQYNMNLDWSRASGDVENRLFMMGSMVTKFGIRISPMLMWFSGAPFNITTGTDNGDQAFNQRPAFATAAEIAAGGPNIVPTAWGVFNTAPGPNDVIIPRNYGTGPGFFNLNLRISKTFGFGPAREGSGGAMDNGGFGGHGGPHGGHGMPMGQRGGGGMRSIFMGDTTSHRFNLVLGANARNLLNTVNYGPPVGNLSSTYFGTSNTIAGGFGPGGFGGGNPAYNRRVELSLRLMF
jgi:Carboxypeptidase regulatory-like domain